jgi:anhydro-N-acetylmuramic acid kinase
MLETVIGLMSGTSLDGVDAAFLRTDGAAVVQAGPWLSLPYPDSFRQRLRACLGQTSAPADIIAELTAWHSAAVKALREQAPDWQPTLIGFHGQTIYHRPAQGQTVQIGDAANLAAQTGLDVVYDFRSKDVQAGGQGAPLVPVYHQALAAELPKPLAILNIGGVANITYIGADGALLAFDTGPGNALIDDWLQLKTGRVYDEDGKLAAQGQVDASFEKLLDLPFFHKPPPKSLDRQDFATALKMNLSPANGAATLTALTAICVREALRWLPERPAQILVTGGGRHNPTLMRLLAHYTGLTVTPVEALGWAGDALEAQAFAYLAKRSRLGLPLSFPGTTAVPEPLTGGKFYPYESAA